MAGWPTLAAEIAAASQESTAVSATPELVRLGVIGLRTQGRLLAARLSRLPGVEIVALCDVDRSQFEPVLIDAAQSSSIVPTLYADYRRLVDDRRVQGVVIAAPDHWHERMVEFSLDAGKDVYLESPLVRLPSELERISQAALRHSHLVTQCGLPLRSCPSTRAALAVLASGELGDVPVVKAWSVYRRKPIGRKPATSTPAGVDYARWLGQLDGQGPTPFRPNRFHGNWTSFWDFGAGELGRTGVHWLDLAAWSKGLTTPRRILASGGRLAFDDEAETPDTLTVHYEFPQCHLTWEHRLWTSFGPEGRSTGLAFHGERGTLMLDRGGWKIYGRTDASSNGPAGANSSADAAQVAHLANFVDAMRTRRPTVAPISDCLVSTRLVQDGNAAYRTQCGAPAEPASSERA